MLLLLAFILIFLFSIAGIIFLDADTFSSFSEVGFSICFFCAVVSVIAFLVMGLVAAFNNVGVEGTIAANQKIYESLVYQLENDIYDNDNDLGKKELYDSITKWNSNLAHNKAMQHDFWLGVFYPNIYDDFEFIELK